MTLTPKPLVYVAGPYSHPDPVENTHKAIIAAERIEALGCAVVIPHLSLAWHLVSPAPLERWYERDLHVLERCDALVRLPGASSGADAEVEFARERGLPAFAGNVTGRGSLLAEWIDEWVTSRTKHQEIR